MSRIKEIRKLPHHEPSELCRNRANYRQGRKLLSVKAYTVNQESIHLIISGVPIIGLQEEITKLCRKFGFVEQVKLLYDYPGEQFTEAFYIKYRSFPSARRAKKFIDNRIFYGKELHVCYAPELESVDETRDKLICRRREVAARLRMLDGEKSDDIVLKEGEKPVSRPRQYRKSAAGKIAATRERSHWSRNGESVVTGPCIWKGIPVSADPRPTQQVDAQPIYGPVLPPGVGNLSQRADDELSSSNYHGDIISAASKDDWASNFVDHLQPAEEDDVRLAPRKRLQSYLNKQPNKIIYHTEKKRTCYDAAGS